MFSSHASSSSATTLSVYQQGKILSGVFSLKTWDSRQNWSDTSFGAHTVWAGLRGASNLGRRLPLLIYARSPLTTVLSVPTTITQSGNYFLIARFHRKMWG
jgi:hypothetical protein